MTAIATAKCERVTLTYKNKALELHHGKKDPFGVESYLSLLSYNARLFYGDSMQTFITVDKDDWNTAGSFSKETPTQKYMITVRYADYETYKQINMMGSIIDLTSEELEKMGIKTD